MKSTYCSVKRYESKGEDNLQKNYNQLSHEVPFMLGMFSIYVRKFVANFSGIIANFPSKLTTPHLLKVHQESSSLGCGIVIVCVLA